MVKTRAQTDCAQSKVITRRNSTSSNEIPKKIGGKRRMTISNPPQCTFSSVKTRSQTARDNCEILTRQNSTSSNEIPKKISGKRRMTISNPPQYTPVKSRVQTARAQAKVETKKINGKLRVSFHTSPVPAGVHSTSGSLKSILKKPRKELVIRLNRLNFSLLEFCAPKTIKIGSSLLPTISFCRECASSFDGILEQKRKAIIAPYELQLKQRIERNKLISKELAELENQWHFEMKSWFESSNKVDVYQDQLAKMVRYNAQLKNRSFTYHTKTISPEHNYA